jgi:glycosyltransferase involved in cell wall biosynthesis
MCLRIPFFINLRPGRLYLTKKLKSLYPKIYTYIRTRHTSIHHGLFPSTLFLLQLLLVASINMCYLLFIPLVLRDSLERLIFLKLHNMLNTKQKILVLRAQDFFFKCRLFLTFYLESYFL